MFKPTLTWFVAACLSIFVLASPTRAQFKLDTLSAWGGAVNAFQRVGNIGYCGSGQRFVVLDMNDEANIHELGSINLDTTVEDIVIRGNYAYVLCQDYPHLFSVLDISTPSSPQIVWTQARVLNGVPAGFTRLQSYGNLVYLLRPNAQLVYAFNMTNPSVPVIAATDMHFGASGTPSSTLPRDFQVVGDYLYTVGRNLSAPGSGFYLSVFNLQPDPLHPTTLVGNVAIPGVVSATMHLAVANGKAVVKCKVFDPSFTDAANRRDVVRIVNVSDPAHPALTGGYNDLYQANGVAIQGQYAFVADWFSTSISGSGGFPTNSNLSRLKGLAVLDITNPFAPTLVGAYNTDHSCIADVRVSGNRAYVFCQGQGLEILDIADPTNPTRVGGFYSPGALRIMTKSGNRLYAVDEWNGFTILDASNPMVTPTVLSIYRSPGDVLHQGHWNVQVRSNLAYLSTEHGGIEIIDVSDPAAPTLVGGYSEDSADFGAFGLELDGDILHVSGQLQSNPTPQWFFANFDVSNPAEMNLSGVSFPDSVYHRLTSKQGVTFVGAGVAGGGIGRIDNTDPTNPYMFADDLWGGTDLEIVGNTLYAADESNGKFGIVDVTDPFNAVQIESYAAQFCTAVGVAGNRAYIARQSNSSIPDLPALDISDPTSPQISAVSAVHIGLDIIAEGNLIYAVLGDSDYGEDNTQRGGLVIQKFHAACPPNLLTGSGCLGPTDLLSFLTLYFTNYDGQGSAVPGDNQTMPQVNPTSSIYAVGCMPDQQSVTPPVITAAGLKADYDGDCQVGPVDLLHFLTDYFNPASDCFASCFAAAVAPTQIKATTETPRHRVGTQSEAKSQSLKR